MTPFDVMVEKVHAHFQLELIDLQVYGDLRVIKFMSRQTLIDLYKFSLPRTNFPNLDEHPIRMSLCSGVLMFVKLYFEDEVCKIEISLIRIRYAFPIPASIQNLTFL